MHNRISNILIAISVCTALMVIYVIERVAMNSDDKFWIFIWVLLATFILLFTLIFVVGDYEEKKMMVEAGYEQVWDSPGNRVLWVKVRDDNNNTN